MQVPTARRVLLASLVGMPFGPILLVTLDARWLSLIIGLTVLVPMFLIWRRAGLRSVVRVERGAGGISGVLLTATGMNGSPLALVLQSLKYPGHEFRATMQRVFVGQDLIAVSASGC